MEGRVPRVAIRFHQRMNFEVSNPCLRGTISSINCFFVSRQGHRGATPQPETAVRGLKIHRRLRSVATHHAFAQERQMWERLQSNLTSTGNSIYERVPIR